MASTRSGSEWSKGGLRQGRVLSPLLFISLFAVVTTVRLALQRLSADADTLADLMHIDEGVPQEGVREGKEIGTTGGGGAIQHSQYTLSGEGQGSARFSPISFVSRFYVTLNNGKQVNGAPRSLQNGLYFATYGQKQAHTLSVLVRTTIPCISKRLLTTPIFAARGHRLYNRELHALIPAKC